MPLNGTYYLNNSGSRWVVYDNGVKPKIEIHPDKFNELEEPITRTAIWFESFGNFVAARYCHERKTKSTLNYSRIEQAG